MKPRIPGTPIVVSRNGSRVYLTATVAPHTRTRARALASRAGLSLGAILDRAIAAVDLCSACNGRGTSDGPLGLESARCAECGGEKVVPNA